MWVQLDHTVYTINPQIEKVCMHAYHEYNITDSVINVAQLSIFHNLRKFLGSYWDDLKDTPYIKINVDG